MLRIVTPSETLANLQCNFTEEMWNSNAPKVLAVTNWSGEPLFIKQGTKMGSVEKVEYVGQDDPIWSEKDPLPVDVARLYEPTVNQRKLELEN